MDIEFFLNTLLRRKWLIIGASLLAAVVTVAVMLQLPPEYRANAQVQTGIIDYRGVRLTRSSDFVQKFQVDNAFANLITEMTGRATLSKLTARVLMHDLQADVPFRTADTEVLSKLGLDREQAAKVVLVNKEAASAASDPIDAAAKEAETNRLATAYNYDFNKLRGLMQVQRLGETDYLDISFKTESPELSYFLVTEYIKMFITDFKLDQSSEELRDLTFYSGRVDKKKREIDSLQQVVDNYRRGNSVVDLTEQQASVVSQISQIEMAIEQRRKEIRGYENAVSQVGEGADKGSSEISRRRGSVAAANSELDRTKRELLALTEQLSDPGVDVGSLERRIEDKKAELDTRVQRVSALKRLEDSRITDRVESLRDRELDASIELRAARAAVASMQAEASRLRGRASSLVNNEAFLSQLSIELETLRAEYNNLIGERDKSEVIYTRSEHPLAVVEPPQVPEDHESRQIPLVAAFSSVAMATLMSIGLFLMALLDRRLRSPDQMRSILNRDPVVSLAAIDTKKFSLSRLFGRDALPEEERRWLEGIRSLRYEVEQSGRHVVQVTSLVPGAGKSMVLAGLATALGKANNRVLIIDANFKSNTLSAHNNVTPIAHPFEMGFDPKLLPRATAWFDITDIDVIGNLGGSRSLMEVVAGTDLADKLVSLRQRYDYILLESASMDLYADSRELAEYTEGIVCVLDARQKINATDRDSLAWLDAQGDKMLGVVLNHVDLKLLK